MISHGWSGATAQPRSSIAAGSNFATLARHNDETAASGRWNARTAASKNPCTSADCRVRLRCDLVAPADAGAGLALGSGTATAVRSERRHVRRLVEQPEPLPFVARLTEVF